MIRECKSLGMTPLTKEQFEEEDRRIYGDLMRRRGQPPVSEKYDFGSYRNDLSVNKPVWGKY